MSKKHFYSHLIETKELEVELDSLELSQNEKEDLLTHVHSSIHLKILDTALSELPEEERVKLIEHINNEDHERTWEHLLRNAAGIESKIKEAAGKVINEFREEIAKQKKV